MWIQALILILIIAAAIAFYFQQRGLRTAYIWLVITAICMGVWILLFLIPVERATPFVIRNWFQIGMHSVSLNFGLNAFNWPFVFSVAAFNISFFLSAVVRLDIRSDMKYWLTQLMLTAAAIMAITVSNIWTLLIMWTALDILFFFYNYYVIRSAYTIQIFRTMIIKFFGSMLLIWNIARSFRGDVNFSLDFLSQGSGLSLFLAAFLHSGVLPLTFQIENNRTETDRVIQNTFKAVNFLTSFFIVPYLIIPEQPLIALLVFKLIALAATMVFSYQWMISISSTGFGYLLAAISGIIFFLLLSGSTISVAYLLLSTFFSMLWFTLFTHRGKGVYIYLGFFLLTISGLPFTIFSLGARGFLDQGLSINSLILLISYVFILTGFVNRGVEKQDNFYELEPWYQAVYLTGLFMFIFSLFVISIKSFSSVGEETYLWWLSLGVIISSAGLNVGFSRKNRKSLVSSRTADMRYGEITSFFSLNWLFRITNLIRQKFGKLITGFSLLLEGEGGVLWALVLLILMISLINPQ